MARPHPNGITLPADRNVCPICNRVRTNPALAPSGFVFCYPCIHNAITNTGLCPVTHRKCTVDQIRKIYEN
jgi:peroxin-12